MNLPEWLTPGTLATDGFTVFAVAKVQQAKPPAREVVLVAGDTSRYPLMKCRQASLNDLPSAKEFIAADGKACRLDLNGDLLILDDGIAQRRVRIPGLSDAAARNFARAFDGVIVEGWGDAA